MPGLLSERDGAVLDGCDFVAASLESFLLDANMVPEVVVYLLSGGILGIPLALEDLDLFFCGLYGLLERLGPLALEHYESVVRGHVDLEAADLGGQVGGVPLVVAEERVELVDLALVRHRHLVYVPVQVPLLVLQRLSAALQVVQGCPQLCLLNGYLFPLGAFKFGPAVLLRGLL